MKKSNPRKSKVILKSLVGGLLLLAGNLNAETRREKPLSELPEHLEVPDGGIALIADFDHRSPQKIPAYLVNLSGETLLLWAEDGDPYLKLEYRDSDGLWRRAQSHVFSWCGCSIFPRPKLPHGYFLNLRGYQPRKGTDATVRFRLHRQEFSLVSNAGIGIWNPEDAELAQRDDLAIAEGDFEPSGDLEREIYDVLGGIAETTSTYWIRDIVQRAVSRLVDHGFTLEEIEAALLRIVADDNSAYSRLAERWLEVMVFPEIAP